MLKKRNRRQESKGKQRVKTGLSTATNKIHNHQKLIYPSQVPNLKTNLNTLVISVLRAFAQLWV